MRGIVGQSEQRLRSAIDLIEELASCLVFMDVIAGVIEATYRRTAEPAGGYST